MRKSDVFFVLEQMIFELKLAQLNFHLNYKFKPTFSVSLFKVRIKRVEKTNFQAK